MESLFFQNFMITVLRSGSDLGKVIVDYGMVSGLWTSGSALVGQVLTNMILVLDWRSKVEGRL